MSWGVSAEEMCRACMRVDSVLLPMYDGQLESKNLPVKLAELASIQIHKGDGLPSKLCAKCAYRTDAFHDFKIQVQATEIKLREIFNAQDPSSVKVEIPEETVFFQVESIQDIQKPDATLESLENETPDVNYSKDSTEEVNRRDRSPEEFSPESEFHDVVGREIETVVQDLKIGRTADDDVEDLLKADNSEYSIVYLSNTPQDALLSENEGYVFIGPEDTAENAPASSTSELKSSQVHRSSVIYESKSSRLAFLFGKVVEGEDSESDDRQKLEEEMANGVESDGEDSDYFADPKDNILGSLNDTIIKIKEIRTANNEMSYQCSLCMQNYEELTGALNHIVDNHVPATGPFFCTVCEKDCESRRELRSHVKVHTGTLPYVCFICHKAYSVKRYLKRHMVSHPDFFRHRCPKCGQRFKVKNELETHVTSHIHGSPYACSQCPRVFNHKGNYKRHLITHLDPHGLHLPKFPCNICGKRFLNNRTLDTHMRVHTGEKPFKCNTCNKKFSQQGNLLNHMRIHSNPRSYTCEVCGKQFNQRSTLKDHSLLHTGEKPYVCTVCGIAFTFSAALRRHMWTHASGKPYGCEICDARFVGKYDLKRHMTIHSDRPRSRKRRTQNVDEDFHFRQPGEEVEARDIAADNTETILIEQVLLNQDVTQVVIQEESEKENVDALFTLIQYGE